MKKQIIRRFGNKRGMTFVELLVALTLLMVIILAFTPMLLYSYNNIYKAGEINELTYDAKSDIEKGLATRNTVNVYNNFENNFFGIGSAAKINLRRIVSNVNANVKGTIETLFYGGKGSIRIVSSQTVNDDTDAKRVVILVKGINFDSVVFGDCSLAGRDLQADGSYKYRASIEVYKPNNTKAVLGDPFFSAVEASKLSGIKTENGIQSLTAEPGVTKNEDSNEYLITLVIKGQDLTNSPVKILMNYVDENGHEFFNTPLSDDAISAYLYIEPPTMLLTGATSNETSYYTTAGVVNGSLKVEARYMSDILIPSYTTTKLQSVKWISNDKNTGYNPYYVLTGTNGVIMRLYRPATVSGYTSFTSSTGSNYEPTVINDSGITRTVFPVTWGGDFSHQFFYNTYYGKTDSGDDGNHTDYGADYFIKNGKRIESDRKNDECWETEKNHKNDSDLNGKGKDGIYSTQAKLYYYFNTMGIDFTFESQERRNISYILTEWGSALRFFGKKMNDDDFSGYQEIWNVNTKKESGIFNYNDWSNILYTTGSTQGSQYIECAISNIAVKSLGTGNINDVLKATGKDGRKYSNSANDLNYYNQTNLSITDSVYMPSLNSMFYVGSASAKSVVSQLDNVRKKNDEKQPYADVYKNGNARWGSFTLFALVGDPSGVGTTIYRGSADDDSEYYSNVLFTNGNSAYFLKSLQGGSGNQPLVWRANHRIEKIKNHTYGTTDIHEFHQTPHVGTCVFDSVLRDDLDEGEHKNSSRSWRFNYSQKCCDLGGPVWCKKVHCGKDDTSDDWYERVSKASNYNGAAVHFPHDCWCGEEHLEKVKDGNPNPYYLGEDNGKDYHFTKCICGKYHNVGLDTLNDTNNNLYNAWRDTLIQQGGLIHITAGEVRELFYGGDTDYGGRDYNLNAGDAYKTYGTPVTPYYFPCPGCGVQHKSQDEATQANLLPCQQPNCEYGGFHKATENLDLKNYDVCRCQGYNCSQCSVDLSGGCPEQHLPKDEAYVEALNNVEHETSVSFDGRAYYSAAEIGTKSTNIINSSLSDEAHKFFVTRTCGNAFFSDLCFTLGFSSNREYVYSNIAYGVPTGSDEAREAYKSYEKYYFLSHYGNTNHALNYATCNNKMSITNQIYWNKADNDYYNVWFPGECYNLTKTASKEGVTVAVGYAVSGSSYQFIGTNKNSSTALGGVFNDGVLAACIDGKDTELTNLLYFKDNTTMDTKYLSDVNPDTSAKYNSAYGTFKYGTHTRQSVRFTAVDLWISETKIGTLARRDYYAFYGDSTGRVFKSLVAYTEGTVSGEEGDNELGSDRIVEKVNYISDLSCTADVKTNSGGDMEEIRLGASNVGASLTNVFSEITNIVASEDIIVISGKQKDNMNLYVVVGIRDGENQWSFGKVKVLSSQTKTYTINSACIMDGYYYFAGAVDSEGYLAAVPIIGFTTSTETISNPNTPQQTTVVTTTLNEDCTSKTIVASGNMTEILSMAGRGAG